MGLVQTQIDFVQTHSMISRDFHWSHNLDAIMFQGSWLVVIRMHELHLLHEAAWAAS